MLDGRTICADTAAAYSCAMRAGNGLHWITARAYDAAGNVAESTLRVYVS
jgi:hypothetical protein